jgi:hypothetical protein
MLVQRHGRPRTVVQLNAGSSTAALQSSTAPPRVALVGFRAGSLAAIEAEYARLGVDQQQLARWLAEPALLPRTIWVHEIVRRYVFERDTATSPRDLSRPRSESKYSRPVASARSPLFGDRGRDRGRLQQSDLVHVCVSTSLRKTAVGFLSESPAAPRALKAAATTIA